MKAVVLHMHLWQDSHAAGERLAWLVPTCWWLCLRLTGTRLSPRLLLAVAPAYVWLAALTVLPHKEERFLYVTYPVVS